MFNYNVQLQCTMVQWYNGTMVQCIMYNVQCTLYVDSRDSTYTTNHFTFEIIIKFNVIWNVPSLALEGLLGVAGDVGGLDVGLGALVAAQHVPGHSQTPSIKDSKIFCSLSSNRFFTVDFVFLIFIQVAFLKFKYKYKYMVWYGYMVAFCTTQEAFKGIIARIRLFKFLFINITI